MSLRQCLLVVLIFCGLQQQAQLRVIKQPTTHPRKTTLAFGAGITRSVVYLNRNVKEDNDARGLNLNMTYGGSKLIRFSLEYIHYEEIDISPTWYDIKARTIEGNLHFLAKTRDHKVMFFPIIGLSYNLFSGYFTGINDNLNLKAIYPVNQRSSSNWVGLNVGTGLEFYFKPGSFFADYKMRVGVAEGREHLNIMDVCLNAGFRFNLRVPSIYSIFQGPRGRYFLDKPDTDW